MQEQDVYIIRIQLFIELLQEIFAERLIPCFYILPVFVRTAQMSGQAYFVAKSF